LTVTLSCTMPQLRSRLQTVPLKMEQLAGILAVLQTPRFTRAHIFITNVTTRRERTTTLLNSRSLMRTSTSSPMERLLYKQIRLTVCRQCSTMEGRDYQATLV